MSGARNNGKHERADCPLLFMTKNKSIEFRKDSNFLRKTKGRGQNEKDRA